MKSKIVLIQLFCLVFSISLKGQVLSSDSLALVSIKNENCMGCPLIENWNPALPVSSWSGVFLSTDGTRVEILTLDQTELNGVLTAEITQLAELKYLYINYNPELTGLASLDNLDQLLDLTINGSYSLSTLPNLNDLTSLQSLVLQNNNITNMPSLENNTELTGIHLNSNPNLVPFGIGHLVNLNYLGIINCLVDTIPGIENCLNLTEIDVRENRLTFSDLESIFLTLPSLESNSNYIPQWHGAIEKEQSFYEGGTLVLDVSGRDDSPNNVYTWFKDQDFENPVATTTMPYLTLENVNTTNAGNYNARISNPNLPDLTIINNIVDLSFKTASVDSLGGEFVPDEYIVKFVDGLTEAEKQDVRDEFGAIQIDSCMCALELWSVDSIFDPSTGTWIIDPENKKEKMASSADVETVDYNYLVEANAKSRKSSNLANISMPNLTSSLSSTPTVRVAIIDTGIDQYHNTLENSFWRNDAESSSNGLDNDFNCIVDDSIGYDFSGKKAMPIERQLVHGTHVAGLVRSFSNGTAEMMDLKIFGNQTVTTLFAAVCATYYAVDKEAKIINMSWGWEGLPAAILYKAIHDAGEGCGALFVCSAGNKNMNNDSLGHYPSGYNLDNILEVGATITSDLPTFIKAPYSNYGNSVDISTFGTWNSTIPNNLTDELEGTSMSAAVITGITTRMYDANSSISWQEIKKCLFENSLSDSLTVTDTLNNRWFRPINPHINSAINCIEDEPIPDECPQVVSTYSPLFQSILREEMLIYPNPTRDKVSFEFEFHKSSNAEFIIYDIRGRTLHYERMYLSSGKQTLSWDAAELPSGIYLCTLKSDSQYFSGKMIK